MQNGLCHRDWTLQIVNQSGESKEGSLVGGEDGDGNEAGLYDGPTGG